MLSTDPEMRRLSNWHRSTASLSRQAIAVGMQKVMEACAVCDAIIADMRRLWPQLNTFLVVGGGDGSRSSAAPRRVGADWFSGVGGASFGGQQQGVTIQSAIEWQPRWARLFAKNFGVRPMGDVTSASALPANANENCISTSEVN